LSFFDDFKMEISQSFTGLEGPMRFNPTIYSRSQGAIYVRRRARKRTFVLQVTGNKADAARCERLRNFYGLVCRGKNYGTHGLVGFDPFVGFNRLAQGKHFDGGYDRAALNLCEQLTGEALQVGPIVDIVETYWGRHGQGPPLQHVHV
jgi:hypothetical protein